MEHCGILPRVVQKDKSVYSAACGAWSPSAEPFDVLLRTANEQEAVLLTETKLSTLLRVLRGRPSAKPFYVLLRTTRTNSLQICGPAKRSTMKIRKNREDCICVAENIIAPSPSRSTRAPSRPTACPPRRPPRRPRARRFSASRRTHSLPPQPPAAPPGRHGRLKYKIIGHCGNGTWGVTERN